MAIRSLGFLNPARLTSPEPGLPEFLSRLMPDHQERRDNPRMPICRDVTLYFDGSQLPTPAILNNVSVNGLGILHEVPIETKEATVRIRSDTGETLCARVKFLWHKASGRGCYTSGGTFVRVFERDPIQLREHDENRD